MEGSGPGRLLRFLPKRVIQAMAEHATANFILGERTVPGRWLVLRLVDDEEERAEQEQQYTEAREAIEKEILREARSRDFRLRSGLDVELRVLARSELESGEAAALLRPLLEEEDLPGKLERLRSSRELILTRRLHSLAIDSHPRSAAVYVDDRQLERTTPCRIDDLPAGIHTITLSLPGYLLHEGEVEIPEDGQTPRQRYVVELQPEPPMGVLEVLTFPNRATLSIAGEIQESPARFRLPAGRHTLTVSRAEYATQSLTVDLPVGSESAPERLQVRLEYAGEDRDEPVGTLIIFKPEEAPPPLRSSPRDLSPLERPEDTLAAFFGDAAVEGAQSLARHPAASADILGHRPIYKGVLVIGREDRRSGLIPDVKLFDPGNTVSRGCHAWLHVYTDPGTGAEYNTFVIHNNRPAGILVDGQLVKESVALADTAEIRIGIFRMQVRKETPAPSVQF
jgi:hypothetical protein